MTDALWDAEVLSRVRHLHLRARHLTDALLMGEHRSRRVGQAVEFADYTEYLPGMDLRALDWRVWARSDRLVVKRYETETELPSTVVLDLSGDMATGTPAHALPDLDASKAGVAITLAATLAYFLHMHGEPVGLEVVAGKGMAYRSLPPRGGRNHLQTVFLSLASARPGGVADLGTALLKVGSRTRRRSLVMLLTDGMEEPSSWLPALSAFARRKADLRFFHLYDGREWRLDLRDPSRFYSPEGGEELPVDPGGARQAFQEVVKEYVAEVKGDVVRWGGRYIPVDTSAPVEETLRRALVDSPVPVPAPWEGP